MDVLLTAILFEGITVVIGLTVISTRVEILTKRAKDINDRLTEIANLLKK